MFSHKSLLSMELPYLVVRDITTLQLWKPSRFKAAQRWACKKKAGMAKKNKKKHFEIRQFPSLFRIHMNKMGFFRLKCIYLFNRKRKNPLKLNFVKKNILCKHRRVCSTSWDNYHLIFFLFRIGLPLSS